MFRCLLSIWLMAASAFAVAQDDNELVTLVLVPAAERFDLAKFRTTIHKAFGDSARFDMSGGNELPLAFDIGRARLALSLVDVRGPDTALESACNAAWLWGDGACEAVDAHRAYFRVVQSGTAGPKLAAAGRQTQVVNALVRATDALAVFWGTNFVAPDTFTELATDDDVTIPALLWIAYGLTQEDNGDYRIATRGMTDFGLLEIEARTQARSAETLFGFVYDLSVYLLEMGPVIADGDTVGQKRGERIEIRYAPSFRNEDETVYRVEFASSGKRRR